MDSCCVSDQQTKASHGGAPQPTQLGKKTWESIMLCQVLTIMKAWRVFGLSYRKSLQRLWSNDVSKFNSMFANKYITSCPLAIADR